MISNKLIRQLCERLWLELTTYEIKDDNAFVLFPPRFISTAFFFMMWVLFGSDDENFLKKQARLIGKKTIKR